MNPLQYSMIRTLERVFVVIALVFLMGGMEPFISSWTPRQDLAVDTGGSGDIRFQILSLSIYSIGITFLLMDYRRAWKLIAGNPLIFALLIYLLFSAFWSPYPATTFRRGFALVLTTAFAMYLVLRFSPKELLVLLGWAFVLACAMSYFFALFTVWGKHRIGPHTGLWRGTFGHKNVQGLFAAMTVFVMLLLQADSRGPIRWLWWATIGAAIGLLYMANSATSIATLVGVIATWPAVRALRRGRLPLNVKLPVVLIVTFGIVLVAGVQILTLGLEALGRSETLTGRTTLWTAAIHEGMKNAWFGVGYRTFWTEAGARNVYAQLSWEGMRNGHNGYLDVWLELGIAGCVLLGLAFAKTVKRVWQRLVTSTDNVGVFYALFLAFLLVYSFPERVILEQSNLMWALFLMTSFWLTPQRVPAVRTAPRPVHIAAPPTSFGGRSPQRG
ncbi:O-antigen ligase family protein [Arenibaculum pallidiluteum]|uniref:O-antigen ligase family protein n=1 Tax=Arenibaculum pallidiluteum TaxID=2812559 RepID=UPI001A97D24B|nr:O-antigen ligase [Arenibaculum pallidiluteum]